MKVTKSQICDTAMALFQQHGFESVSVEDICNACEVTRGSFYHHYTNKYDVLIFWERRHAEKEIQQLEKLEGGDPACELYRYLFDYAKEISAVGADLMYRIMLATIESGDNGESSHTGMGTYVGSDALVGLIMNAAKTDKAHGERLLRHYNMAITGLVFEWKLSNGNFDFPSEANQIAQTVFGNQNQILKGR